MIRRFYSSLLWLPLISFNGFSSQDWNEKKNKDGIRIEVRKLQNHKYQEIRAETIIDSSITEVFQFISNTNSCEKWVYRCGFSEERRSMDRETRVIYQLTKFPFPFKSREVFLTTKTTLNPDGSIKIRMESTKNEKREKSSLLEIKKATIEYLLTPTPEGVTRISWQQYVDPGGNLPTWAVDKENIFFVQKSLGNLKKIMAPD
tara:strand:- start:19 stop:627 length:609 start_codon:yes stop_codon:yes gene_type:complete